MTIRERVAEMYTALGELDLDKRYEMVMSGPTNIECVGCCAPSDCMSECWRYKKFGVTAAKKVWEKKAEEWLDLAAKLL